MTGWVGVGYLFLTTCIGMALIRPIGRQLGRVGWAALGGIAGLLVTSFLVILVDLSPLRIERDLFRFLVSVLGVAALAVLWMKRRDSFPVAPRWRAYEWITALVLFLVIVTSAWKNSIDPVSVRDTIVGADLVAIYAIEDGTIASRVFTGSELEGKLSAQPFYMPFTMTEQIAWRLLGFPMGKMWLSFLFLCTNLVFYTWLRRRIHPALAGVLSVMMVSTPMMFTFSYLISTDYSNAAFVGLAAIFASENSRAQSRSNRLATAVFLGAAVWTRAETILLVPLLAAIEVGVSRTDWSLRIRTAVLYCLPGILALLLWHGLYMGFKLPGAPDSSGLVRMDSLANMWQQARGFILFLVDPIFGGVLILGAAWGIAEVLLFRRRVPWRPLLWTVASVVSLVVILWLFRAAGLDTTIKRGFMRTIPLVLVFVASTHLTAKLSAWLTRIETRSR